MNLANTLDIGEREARRLGVSPAVHPDDFIFRYLVKDPFFASREDAIKFYFEDGARSARLLQQLLTGICKLSRKRFEMLEFASGYGCVTRHLKTVSPNCDVTSCDIHPEAIQFLQGKFSVKAVLSSAVPEELILDRTYDVVFALSFFSHMPKVSFARWLMRLASFVKPQGFLIFTTHGLVSQEKHLSNCRLDSEGFCFHPNSEQLDLNPAEYGISIVRPQYVTDLIFGQPRLRLVFFQEGFWWEHQDVYVIQVPAQLAQHVS